jgi:hypothetical protein
MLVPAAIFISLRIPEADEICEKHGRWKIENR